MCLLLQRLKMEILLCPDNLSVLRARQPAPVKERLDRGSGTQHVPKLGARRLKHPRKD